MCKYFPCAITATLGKNLQIKILTIQFHEIFVSILFTKKLTLYRACTYVRLSIYVYSKINLGKQGPGL